MKCILYARVSTDKQAEKDLSIPAQLDAMRDYVRQRQWTIMEEFLEPGASAKTADRPAFQRLLSGVRDGSLKADVVLVHKLDRFARNLYDYAIIKALLQEHKIRLVSVVENVEPSVSGELIEGIMAAMAQFYSANLSEEVKKGMRQKVLGGGWPHRPPRGYLVVRSHQGNAIEIHPREGPLMKRAFELYATGWYSIQVLAQRLAREGLCSKTNTPMSHAHLTRLLSNSFYTGIVHWHELEIPGAHPALISRDLFDKVQAVIRQRYRNPGRRGSVIPGFPMRGLAICSGCRGHMTCERHGKSGYYRCSRQTYRRELCDGKACNADRAHLSLEHVCRRLVLDREIAKGIQIAAAGLLAERAQTFALRRERLEADLAALTSTEMELTQAFTKGDISPNTYATRTAELRAKRQAVAELAHQPLVSVESLSDYIGRALQIATSLWDLYQSRREEDRATLLRHVFQSIVLDREGIAGFTLKPPFAELFAATASQRATPELAAAVVDAAA